MLTRKQVAERLGQYYSRKYERETGRPANVWSYYDDSKRAYCLRGENLPSNISDHGWSLLDYIKPMVARRLIVPPANKNY